MKVLKKVILAAAILLIIGLVLVFIYLNSIVRQTVQTQATNSLNLATTLGSANVSVFGGQVGLSDLAIASPPGYGAEPIVSLKNASVGVHYSEMTDDPVRIAEVTITGPRLVLEQKDGKLNINAMMERMPKTPQTPEPSQPKEQKPLRVIISKLQVNDATVVLHPGLPGLANEIVVPVGSITLENVGSGASKDQKGATMKEVVMRLATALTDAAAKSDKIPAQLRGLLNSDLSRITQQMSEQFNQLGETLKKNPADAGKALQDLGKGLDKGLKGLIPQDEKK